MSGTWFENQLLLQAAKELIAYCKRSDFDDLDFGRGLQQSHLISAMESIVDDIERGVGGWQPIETAPKDGTAVLTFRGAKLIAVADWDAGCGYWIVTDGMPLVNVTHWMPLPEPPK